MAIKIPLDPLPAQTLSKCLAGLAQIVQQRSELGKQANRLSSVPVIFVLGTQDVVLCRIGWSRSPGIEPAPIPHYPKQLAVVKPANPMASNSRVLPGSLAQKTTERIQTILCNGCLPSAVSAPFGELVNDSARFLQRTFVTLGYEENIHGCTEYCACKAAFFPIARAVAFTVSIMKSSDSERTSASIQCCRNSCSPWPRMADRKA